MDGTTEQMYCLKEQWNWNQAIWNTVKPLAVSTVNILATGKTRIFTETVIVKARTCARFAQLFGVPTAYVSVVVEILSVAADIEDNSVLNQTHKQ